MRSVTIGVFLLLLSPAGLIRAQPQSTDPAADQPRSEFFSGSVTALADDKITVFKTVLGKNSETRTFLINRETRVEGKLRMKARVTVRYTHGEEGDRALHIIVRVSQKK